MGNSSWMKVERIAESILQYFWPALSDIGNEDQFLVFILSGRLRQALLYYKPNLKTDSNADFIPASMTSQATIDPQAKRHSNGVSLVDPDSGPLLYTYWCTNISSSARALSGVA